MDFESFLGGLFDSGKDLAVSYAQSKINEKTAEAQAAAAAAAAKATGTTSTSTATAKSTMPGWVIPTAIGAACVGLFAFVTLIFRRR